MFTWWTDVRATSPVKTVRAVERAIEILQGFSVDNPAMTVVELQKKVRLSRPTLYRLLHTLMLKGLVRAQGEPQRFALDYGVAQLAHVWMSTLDVANAAGPILSRLRDRTGESAAFYVLRGNTRTSVLEMPCRHALSIVQGLGRSEPLFRGASGKIILAFMSDQAVGSALQNLPPGISKKRVLDDLAKYREDGFAVSRGEVVDGAVAIASPVFDRMGNIVGSITVSAPQTRVDDSWMAHSTKLVISSASELSMALGYGVRAVAVSGLEKARPDLLKLHKIRSSGRPR